MTSIESIALEVTDPTAADSFASRYVRFDTQDVEPALCERHRRQFAGLTSAAIPEP